jgi:hypothetical protein
MADLPFIVSIFSALPKGAKVEGGAVIALDREV